MTATFDSLFPMKRPLRWNVFFAEESDRDLDFDEGFEEDELHQSKPAFPSSSFVDSALDPCRWYRLLGAE